MSVFRVPILTLFLAIASSFNVAFAQSLNEQPKYGSAPKNDAQKAADKEFLAAVDKQYGGDRKKAATDLSARGWQALRQGDASTAMRRFNQAWLADGSNGDALWGMAAVQAERGRTADSLALFGEADRSIGADIDFAADYARAVGFAGARTKNDTLLKDAFSRFQRVYEKAPQHTLNLQNWAITHFYVGNYAEAWKKIQLAEKTPRSAELDQRFISDLRTKMPRP